MGVSQLADMWGQECGSRLAQENALRSAENYLGTMPFSQQGLIHQLSSEYGEGFTRDQATYAVDTIGL